MKTFLKTFLSLLIDLIDLIDLIAIEAWHKTVWQTSSSVAMLGILHSGEQRSLCCQCCLLLDPSSHMTYMMKSWQSHGRGSKPFSTAIVSSGNLRRISANAQKKRPQGSLKRLKILGMPR